MSTFKTMTAALIAGTLATAAFAESQGVGAKVGVGADANAAAQGSMNYGQIVSQLKNGTEKPADWASEIAGLSQDATVNIVPLSELKGEAAENASALDTLVADAQTDVDATRSAISANTELTAALEAQNYTADDVVAVMIDGDSQATLIVDDQS